MILANGIDWTPGIGDPTIAGWLTVVAYAAATILCYRAAQADRPHRRIWAGLGVFELLLGLNKQLDLQILLVETARSIAKQGGWYADRQPVQIGFMIVLAFMFVTLIVLILGKARHQPRTVRVALFGASVELVFVLLRAASFDHVDTLLHTPLGGANFNVYLENSGILLVAVCAWAAASGAGRRQV